MAGNPASHPLLLQLFFWTAYLANKRQGSSVSPSPSAFTRAWDLHCRSYALQWLLYDGLTNNLQLLKVVLIENLKKYFF